MSSADERSEEFEWADPEEESLFAGYSLEELEELSDLRVTLGEEHVEPTMPPTPRTDVTVHVKDGEIQYLAIAECNNHDAAIEAEAGSAVILEDNR